MRQATLYRYRLPVDAGVALRNQRLKSRDGLLVRLHEDGREGWGEIAPLPEFSHETLPEAQEAACRLLAQWQVGAAPAESPLPSVAFGLSCAQAELSGTLPQAANYRSATLCNGDPDALFQVLQSIPGEKVAKVKVGLYEAVRDGMIVSACWRRCRICICVWMPTVAGPGPRRMVLPSMSIRTGATVFCFWKSRARPAMSRAPLPATPGSPSPGMRACAMRTSASRRSRAWRPSSSSRP